MPYQKSAPLPEALRSGIITGPPAGLPPNEETRLEVLHSYQIMDTAEEAEFNNLVELASYICGTPMALIGLIDERRQWFKAKTGIPVTETERSLTFCQYTIQGNDLLEVPNAQQDARFCTNPYVTGEPHIRYYCGAPLVNPEGFRLGSLCVIDSVPRTLNSQQKFALKTLATEVSKRLELRRQHRQLEAAHQRLLAEKQRVFISEERYRRLVENNGSYIFTHALNGTILSANRAMIQALTAGTRQIAGKNLAELISPADQDQYAQYLNQLRTERETSGTFLIGQAAEESRYWLCRSFRFDEPDGSSYVIVSAQDITDREVALQILTQAKAEVEQLVLARTKKLRLSTKELSNLRHDLSTLVYQASHNLLGPICTMQGLLNLATQERSKLNQQEFIQLIGRTVNKLHNLTTDLIAYSENIQRPVNYERIDFSTVAAQAAKRCRQLGCWGNVDLEIAVAVPAGFLSDADRLITLLKNLMENACCFRSPLRPNLQIRVDIRALAGKIHLTVTDNADPIPAEALPRIFDLFYLYSIRSGCSGLSMPLVRDIVRKLSGTIRVESVPDTGNCYFVELPGQTY
jgi:PAS domain S-box-containing protein